MAKKKKWESKLHPYKRGFLWFLPLWFKIQFMRWWIVGIAYFFLGFGASFLRPGSYEQMFSIGAVIGLLNSFIISTVIRDMSHMEDKLNPYLSIRKKGPIGTLTNIALSVVIVILIGFSYDGLNRLMILAFSLEENRVYFPAEPLGFALLYLGYDFLWRILTFRRKRNSNKMKSEQNSSDEEF